MRNVLVQRIRRNLNAGGAKKVFFYPIFLVAKYREREKYKRRAYAVRKHYEEVAAEKKKSSRLRFGAYIMYDSSCGCDGLVNLMKKEPWHWDIKMAVIPDISRGYAHMLNAYQQTRNFLIQRYGTENVTDGYDIVHDKYIDLSEQFDIIYCSNPYDAMAAEVHSIKYLSTKDVLPVYIGYGFENARLISLSRLKSYELNFVWKCFTETEFSRKDYKKHGLIKGKNVVLSGYGKMDSLFEYSLHIEKEKKKILLSPHHTISLESLPLSNFQKYCDLILQLPELFPDIDFVFRPHPLLFHNLLHEKLWSQQQIDEYLVKIKRKGMEYSDGGDYFQLFSECDAIVHDCGSYITEWLYTGKPCCFVWNENLKKRHLTKLGLQALKRYNCIACSKDEIIGFIRRVESGDTGYLRQCENNRGWIAENIMIHYPNASKKILEEIDIVKNTI